MSWSFDGQALAGVAADVAALCQVLLSGCAGRLLAAEKRFVTIKKRCGWGVLLCCCAYAREGEGARAWLVCPGLVCAWLIVRRSLRRREEHGDA
jgi:hypothetical protein